MNFVLILILGFFITALLCMFIMPHYIEALKALKYNQTVSEYALDEYKNKSTTPIMGGLLFVLVPVIVSMVINPATFKDPKTLLVIFSYISFCFIGFLDDFLIIVQKNNKGLSPKVKMLLQVIFAFIIYLLFRNHLNFNITIPVINYIIPLGVVIYGLFFVFVYCAEANAVNFTDGMDGLSSGVSIIALIPFIILASLSSEYNLVILLVCILAGLLVYLKFNFFPAKIFMGDSGSLAIGALFASIAIALNKELLLLVIGGVFLIEMVCVCLQQLSVRLFHKRIFSYTPIHYAFSLKGMREKKVVIMFYVVQLIFSIIGLVIGVL